MTNEISWIDRARIERAVWLLDQRLYDLPRRSRIAHRRELRENLITASHELGARAALRNLGDPRVLAAEYLSAQYGDRARPSWIAAATFLLVGQQLFTWFLSGATAAFADGVLAGDQRASGAYRWSGITYLQSAVSYRFADGRWTAVGGAWTPLAYGLWLITALLVGRLWRVRRWNRRAATLATREAARS
jgi:hypothetical protein